MRVEVDPGLCDRCLHRRIVSTRRGTAFLRCSRSEDDPRFRRYPVLPVTRCDGFVADLPADSEPETGSRKEG